MPRHKHGWRGVMNKREGTVDYSVFVATFGDDSVTAYPEISDTAGMQYAGEGQLHNNIPPYLSVYIWKRIE